MHVRHDILHWLDVPERVMGTRHVMHDRLQVSAQNGTDISAGDVPAEL